ncbi:MAG TPA: hypothetical protein VNZ22_05290, partial [Bacillota bacterium]|nr:hypothetical protein [Bacillota bacterium]
MKITVTTEDIQQSSRCDPDGCPIGRALSRAGVEHYGVVGSSVLVVDDQNEAQSLSLPPQV